MIRSILFHKHRSFMSRAASRAGTEILEGLASLHGTEMTVGLAILLALLMAG